MEKLGNSFVDGKIINLEKTSIEDVNNMLKKVRKEKSIKKNALNNFLNVIYKNEEEKNGRI